MPTKKFSLTQLQLPPCQLSLQASPERDVLALSAVSAPSRTMHEGGQRKSRGHAWAIKCLRARHLRTKMASLVGKCAINGSVLLLLLLTAVNLLLRDEYRGLEEQERYCIMLGREILDDQRRFYCEARKTSADP